MGDGTIPITLNFDFEHLEFRAFQLKYSPGEKSIENTVKYDLKKDYKFTFHPTNIALNCYYKIVHPVFWWIESGRIGDMMIFYRKKDEDLFINQNISEVTPAFVAEINQVFGKFDRARKILKNFCDDGEAFLARSSTIFSEEVDSMIEDGNFPLVVVPTIEEKKSGKEVKILTLKKEKDPAVVKVEGETSNAEKTIAIVDSRKIEELLKIESKKGYTVVKEESVKNLKIAMNILKVGKIVTKSVKVAEPLFDIALLLLESQIPNPEYADKNDIKTIVQDELEKSFEKEAWKDIKKHSMKAFKDYKYAMSYCKNIDKFRDELKSARKTGDDACDEIYDNCLKNENMYPQVLLYAETASFALLSLFLLSEVSGDETEKVALQTKIDDYTRCLQILHDNAKEHTTEYFKELIDGIKGTYYDREDFKWYEVFPSPEEHTIFPPELTKEPKTFALDYDDICHLMVKKFCEFWKRLRRNVRDSKEEERDFTGYWNCYTIDEDKLVKRMIKMEGKEDKGRQGRQDKEEELDKLVKVLYFSGDYKVLDSESDTDPDPPTWKFDHLSYELTISNEKDQTSLMKFWYVYEKDEFVAIPPKIDGEDMSLRRKK